MFYCRWLITSVCFAVKPLFCVICTITFRSFSQLFHYVIEIKIWCKQDWNIFHFIIRNVLNLVVIESTLCCHINKPWNYKINSCTWLRSTRVYKEKLNFSSLTSILLPRSYNNVNSFLCILQEKFNADVSTWSDIFQSLSINLAKAHVCFHFFVT